MTNAIEFRNINKYFGTVQVLNDITFEIKKGSFHAIIGENGAGKSTLLNILHGVYREYEGSFFINGNEGCFKRVSDSIKAGVAKVHQELHIVKDLNAGQNIFLGYEPLRKNKLFISYKELYKEANEILKRLCCSFKATDSVARLSAGELQMITIAKALFHKASIISFDEPTAALSKWECDNLFQVIKDLKDQGITIIYISHRMEEIFEMADVITVLRDGSHVITAGKNEITQKKIIELMIGQNVNMFATRKQDYCLKEEVLLEVKNLSRKNVFKNINFKLRKGEILGFYGLVGAKRTEIMRSIFGADAAALGGEIIINGSKTNFMKPNEACAKKIGFISEKRKTEGFIKHLTNYNNIALPSLSKYSKLGFVNHKKKASTADEYINKVRLTPPDGNMLTSNLSGGNQQKVILAKWLAIAPDILILDEPTKGIDINAKSQIYSILEDMAHQGIGIILVSSEIQEITGLCDRAVIMYEGKQITTLERNEFNQEIILMNAFGG